MEDSECSHLELGTVRTRAVLRCKHLNKWTKKLGESGFERLGFKDMDAFSLHHILLDDAALLHVSKNSRTLCRADNACTHKGYRALYPTLDKVLDRRHVCFRQRPSHRREDISFVISAFVEKGDRPDRWSPTALLLFSSASSPREHPCKRKAISKEIEPQSFTWTHELKIQLECLQMLSLHFANDPGEQMTVLYEFGEFSDEGNALRDIRQMYTPSSHPDSPDPPTVIPTYTSHAYENDPERVNWSIIEEAKKFIASGNAMIVKVLSGHRGTKLQCSVVGWVDLDVQDE
ncbi:hypothetical protein FRC15_003119 [Serendipita sp. 397]|nr:hypothetical protein FRC15_003119 [Serendipita sp. 397]